MTMQKIALEPGRVYRTRELRRWSANPTRLASELVERGDLRRLRKGIYYRPETSRWGAAPPSRNELLRAFFGRRTYVVTGSTAWNSLGLGSTAVFATPLVYNTTRTGEVEIGGQRFSLRRVRFPRNPTPEWFVVDLIENRSLAGVDLRTLERNLSRALRGGRFDSRRLLAMADRYGSRITQDAIRRCIYAAGPAEESA